MCEISPDVIKAKRWVGSLHNDRHCRQKLKKRVRKKTNDRDEGIRTIGLRNGPAVWKECAGGEKWETPVDGNNGVIRVRRHKKVRKRVETGPAVLYKDYGHHPTVAHLWNGRLETTEQSCRNGSFEKCLTVGVVLGSVTLRQRERSEHENTPESPAFGGQSR
ncbi:hypothetical protein Y032_0168g197 [Ancylostoma ceylanicum]|uniref:Uncharacterized protein n=1 Tax=Ancylostoma ceylanicum TaxID=53326 RepID=A0A016SVJ3_9BILA|nr:hypothetical protein Y032_0168g197 [Ancylostoma ceylanicum]